MNPFDHFSPNTLPEALELLSRLNGRGRVIAGGTDLMLQMKAGALALATVINIKRLPELKGVSYDEAAGLKMGALTTLRELTRSPSIRERYPSLTQAAGLMASEQIRSFATAGGNLCNGSPSADLAPPLIAMGGTAVIAGQSGQRHIPLEAFFLGPGQTALKPGELLQEIHVPPPQGKTIYLKHAPRVYMDIAVVGVAVQVQLDGGVCRQIRIVLGAVAPVPLRVQQAEAELAGRPLTAERINQAAKTAAAACSPIDDMRSSAGYRRRMVNVLVKRGVMELVSRG